MNPFKYAIETLVMEREKERGAVREINRLLDTYPNASTSEAQRAHADNIAVLDEAIQILREEASSRVEAEDREADEVPF